MPQYEPFIATIGVDAAEICTEFWQQTEPNDYCRLDRTEPIFARSERDLASSP